MQMPVDTFFVLNKIGGYDWPQFYKNENAIPEEAGIGCMDYDDANDVHGIRTDEDAPVGFEIILPSDAHEKEQRRQTAYSQMKDNLIEVIFECTCAKDKKIRHHPDYDQPNKVMRLCQKCHSQEHSRINQQEKQLLTNMIAIKLLYRHAA
jgi:hypothetical protein